jgi:hypothetical protein
MTPDPSACGTPREEGYLSISDDPGSDGSDRYFLDIQTPQDLGGCITFMVQDSQSQWSQEPSWTCAVIACTMGSACLLSRNSGMPSPHHSRLGRRIIVKAGRCGEPELGGKCLSVGKPLGEHD